MNRTTPGLPVHHQLPEFTQTHVHRVSDAIQPSHPQSSPSSPAPNPSQHQSLFPRVNSSQEVTIKKGDNAFRSFHKARDTLKQKPDMGTLGQRETADKYPSRMQTQKFSTQC